MRQSAYCMIYITASSIEQARRIGAAIVEERLVACVNIFGGMNSIYRWKDAVHDETEAVIIAKSRRALVDKITARVKELHGYSCPCIVALPIVGGNAYFLDWIGNETAA